MKPITQDPELAFELQELYIESNHWISDLHFAEDEIRFFKNVLHKYNTPALNDAQLSEIAAFNKIFAEVDESIPRLKNKIIGLLKFIDQFISESKNEIGIELIEKFTVLEAEIKALFDFVKQIKGSLFIFIENIMKTNCDLFVNQL